ncbi:MAG: polysaccharide deacetylase family protein [Bacteroidota bacterium]
MRLGVGILAETPQWREMLRQEGVPHKRADLAANNLVGDIAVLIVNRNLYDKERILVEEYLSRGGAVLGFSHHLQGVAGTQHRAEKVEYIAGDHDTLFPEVHLLDVSRECLVPREANCLKTQAGTFSVFAGSLYGGHAVVLPFDIEELVGDHRSVNKNFYSTIDRLPSEQVSVVGKGEARHLVGRAIEYLHHARGLPYLHLWYFPSGQKNLFAFRIDSDGAPQHDVDALYAVARDHNVPMTWFLDVKSHEQWLRHFRVMVGQEFGVHCYEHQTYPTREANLRNIQQAKRLMEAEGLSTAGFAAPFGMWNTELAKAVEEIGFEYTSEFSFAYDTFPMHPIIDDRQYTLQIPVHPICIGSMRKVGYSEKRMIEYYHMVIAQKLARREPLFFYHHPLHRCWNVVSALFQEARSHGIESTTLGEYARWWKKREIVELTATIDGGIIHTQCVAANETCWARVTTSGNRESFTPLSDTINLLHLAWHQLPSPPPAPADIRRIREFDPRAMVGKLYTALSRRFK